MWKINCWLASLSATDTHFNSAVLRQLHVPAYPAPRSWHFPLVPLKSGFIVPGAGGRNKRMPELWAGWQRLRNSSWARRGPLAPRSEGRTPRSAPCPRRAMPRPRCPPGPGPEAGSRAARRALGIGSLQPGPPHDAAAVTVTPAPGLCPCPSPCYLFWGQFWESRVSRPGRHWPCPFSSPWGFSKLSGPGCGSLASASAQILKK